MWQSLDSAAPIHTYIHHVIRLKAAAAEKCSRRNSSAIILGTKANAIPRNVPTMHITEAAQALTKNKFNFLATWRASLDFRSYRNYSEIDVFVLARAIAGKERSCRSPTKKSLPEEASLAPPSS